MTNNGHQKQCFEFADFRLYPHERLLIRNAERVALTPRVMDLLIVLVQQSGEVSTKESLLSSVWTDTFVEEGNLSRAISTLRKSLGAQKNGSDFIETVPKLGYRFLAPVQEVIDDPPKPAKGNTKIGLRGVSAAAALLSVSLLAGYWYWGLEPARPAPVGGLTNLTNNVAEDNLPSFSPDGSKIAFTSNRNGAGDIYVMNVDGSSVRRLTQTTASESSSVWSPDGSKIVFDSDRDGNRELYIMNSDGSGQTRLTFNPTVDLGPVSFSPDGTRVAFARNASNEGGAVYNYDVFTMNIDGSDIRQLTTDPEFDAEPIWSPDGARIVFTSGRNRIFNLYSISPNGAGETNLSPNSPSSFGAVAFGADGKHIYCTGDTPEKIEFVQIYLVNPDGSNRRQVSSFVDKIYRVAYSPQTRKFAVSSKREGNFEIYLFDAGDPPNN